MKQSNPFRKILAVRIGPMGDVTLITPALCAILEHFKDARVDVLTSELGRRTLANFDERIGKVHILNRKHLLYALHKRRVASRLRAEGYDAVFCFEANPGIHAFFKGSNTKLFVPEASNDRYTALECVAEGIAAARGGMPPALGLDRYPLYLPVAGGAAERLDSGLQEMGISRSRRLIGLHPSFAGMDSWVGRLRYGGHSLWPAGHWARLARLIAERFPEVSVIINLMPEERKLGEEILNLSGQAATLWTPPPDFEMYKAYLRRLDVFVSPDTGPMHVAGAVGGARIVLLLANLEQKAPLISPERYRVIRAITCRTPGPRVADIGPEEVFDNCAELLSGRP